MAVCLHAGNCSEGKCCQMETVEWWGRITPDMLWAALYCQKKLHILYLKGLKYSEAGRRLRETGLNYFLLSCMIKYEQKNYCSAYPLHWDPTANAETEPNFASNLLISAASPCSAQDDKRNKLYKTQGRAWQSSARQGAWLTIKNNTLNTKWSFMFLWAMV